MTRVINIPENITLHFAALEQAQQNLDNATCSKLIAFWQSRIEIHHEAIQQWKTQEETCQQ